MGNLVATLLQNKYYKGGKLQCRQEITDSYMCTQLAKLSTQLYTYTVKIMRWFVK